MANSVVFHETTVNVGDTIKISYAINDKDKRKSQLFEGIVLAVKGRETNKMITVRKMTRSGIGVERIFPIISPFVEKVEIVRATHNKKSSVTFIRTRSKREIQEKLYR
ncbi:50S ribosomal protein L19 [Candidatus Woesebacteria bacterium]|nr:50S ribosomal protein L19 [Candidatus Woesebacteria bacterium]